MSSLPSSIQPQALLIDLSDLPPKEPRSKLEPHRELIRILRRRGNTYREIARLFREKLSLHVAPSTIHSFVKIRARHKKIIQFELPPLAQVDERASMSAVQALKSKPQPTKTQRKRFVFRENEPLTLSNNGGTE